MKTIKNLSLIEADYLHNLLAIKTEELEKGSSLTLYAEIALLSKIIAETIPAEKLARHCIEFGETTRTDNTFADEGDINLYHFPTEEIVNDFINNGEIELWKNI